MEDLAPDTEAVAEAPDIEAQEAPAQDSPELTEGAASEEAPAGPRTVEEAIATMRANGGLPTAAEEGEEEPEGQPRNERGQFASPEGEEKEGEAEAPAEGDEGEEAERYTLALMPREAGEDPVEIELTAEQIEALGLEGQELTDAINRTRNGLVRRQELLKERASLQGERQQIQAEREDFYSKLRDDAAATELVLQHTRPEVQEKLLHALIANAPQDVFDEVLDRAISFSRDPKERELAQLKSRLKPEPAEKPEEDAPPPVPQEAREQAQKIIDAFVALAPESMPDHKFRAFYNDAVSSLQTYTKINDQLDQFGPEEALQTLHGLGVLRRHGVQWAPSQDPGQATNPPRTTRRTSPVGNGGEGDDPGTPDPVERRDRRRVAAAVTPGGQGAAAPGTPTPPKEIRTTEDRIKWFRKIRGI